MLLKPDCAKGIFRHAHTGSPLLLISRVEGRSMKAIPVVALLFLTATAGWADEVETFPVYVDSDLCARLMLGPITTKRVECSTKTYKDGAEPVVLRLKDNMVFSVNKQKLLKEYVGKTAEASGEAKVKNGQMKLQEMKPFDGTGLPAGDPARKLLDVRMYKVEGTDKLHERIRHELAMMPYISEYDFISFSMIGTDVILTGWTVRETNRYTAYNLVKGVEGVGNIVNNIDVLPLGSMDNQIRAGARAALAQSLSRYFWGSGSAIKIIVKSGSIILIGVVSSKADSDLAYLRCNSVRGAFKVFNLLRVEEGTGKKS